MALARSEPPTTPTVTRLRRSARNWRISGVTTLRGAVSVPSTSAAGPSARAACPGSRAKERAGCADEWTSVWYTMPLAFSTHGRGKQSPRHVPRNCQSSRRTRAIEARRGQTEEDEGALASVGHPRPLVWLAVRRVCEVSAPPHRAEVGCGSRQPPPSTKGCSWSWALRSRPRSRGGRLLGALHRDVEMRGR